MYENNDPNTENNESSTYRYTPERGTQSDYTAGAHNANSQYSSGPQSGCIPGSYSYSPEPPKKKKKLSAGKIIAIALACAPPELPELMAASVWMRSIVVPEESVTSRSSALT